MGILVFWAFLVVPSEATAPSISSPDLDSLILIEGNSLTTWRGPLFAISPITYAVLTDKKVKINDSLLHELALCESGLNPRAIGDKGTSFGLFQFKKKTWQLYCQGDIWNVEDQLNCVSKMLKDGLWYHWKNCWKKIKILEENK